MVAALSEHPRPGGWTTDDLDALPEDGYRHELIDGVLLVSPSPTPHHQKLASRLEHALETTCPDPWVVLQAVEIRISHRRALIPDLLVVSADAYARNPARFHPHEVLLAIEVVSPSSVTVDRLAKPAIYAHAGIPHFWRIEMTEETVVYTHRLDPESGVYLPTGGHDKVIEVDEPWRIRLPVQEITPPFFRTAP